MIESVTQAYQRLEAVRPLVRPTYNQFEIHLLPPYGDPEVNIPAEVGTYVAAGVLVNSITEQLTKE